MKRKVAVIALIAALMAIAFVVIRYGLVTVSILVQILRDFLVGILLLVLLVRIGTRSAFAHFGLARRLYLFGAGLAALTVLFFVFPKPGTWPSYACSAAAIGFALALFALYRNLVFVQQGRHTERNFRLLLLALLLNLGLVLVSGQDSKLRLPGPFAFDSPNVFSILLVVLAALHGFRCKWIHYITRKSKLILFFAGGVLYGLFLSQSGRAAEAIREASLAGETVLSSLLQVFAVYAGMGLAGILIHLPSAGLMDRKMREVRSFQELSAALSGDLKRETLLAKIPTLAAAMVDAESAWLEMESEGDVSIVSTHGIGAQVVEAFPEAFRAQCRDQAIALDRVLLMNDLSKCRARESGAPAGSLLAASILSQSRRVGVLYAMKPEPFGFVEESQGIFQAFANQVAISLENVELVELSIQRGKAEEELRLAHQAQMRLLPQRMPKVPGYEIEGLCVTANEIGGDFYDVISVGPDRIDIVIGDVSGKGATAAFYMAEFKGFIQALVCHCQSPRDILVEMNTFVKTQCDPDMFLTMVYAVLTPSRRSVRFARAGHCPVGRIRGGKVEWMEPRGLGIGLVQSRMFRARCEEKELDLVPGDTMLFYTDGLTEARNPAREEFGEARLTRLVQEAPVGHADSFVRAITDCIDGFTGAEPRQDDITLVALRFLQDRRARHG
jgi:serine phosphatase RsbU (regulator of sigma subunit)